MKISQELIEEIRQEASVAEVIGHFLPLSKKGRNFVAVCPFHDDHDPSLSLSEEKKMYKCFVCGKGGSVFKFIQDFKHISFPESVAEVAKIIGKPLSIEFTSGIEKKLPHQPLHDVIKETSFFTHYILSAKGGQKARDYLNKRGLTSELVDYFEIGYNPHGHLVYDYLLKKGFRDQDILEANIGKLGSNGVYDIFGGRIVFPIKDFHGNFVGFTARDIEGGDVSKYINTAETKIYVKGDIVYNAFRAREAIKEANRVIVCEGVMDVIAFTRAELPFVVATLGTACSKNQLAILKSLSRNIVLAYDGDEAGQKAMLNLGKMCLQENLQVSVMANDTGLDPDEIILTYEEKGLRDVVSKAIPFMEFVLRYYRKHLQLENYSDRKKMMLEVGAYIDLLQDKYDRDNYEEELALLTKIRRHQDSTAIPLKKEYNKTKTYSVPKYSIDGLSLAEYSVLAMMADSMVATERYKQDLGSLLSENCEELALLIIDEYRRYGNCQLSRILDNHSQNKEMEKLILEISDSEIVPQHYQEDLFKGAISRIHDELLSKKLAYQQERLEKFANISTEEAEKLMKEIAKLTKEKNRRIYGKEKKCH